MDDEPDQQPAQFDEFQGGDAGIFAARKGEYDDDDREADAIPGLRWMTTWTRAR